MIEQLQITTVDVTSLIGVLVFLMIILLAYFIFASWERPHRKLDEWYTNTERLAIDKYLSAKHGIDYIKEMVRLNSSENGSFRRELEREVIKDFFKKGKDEEKKAR